jgi:uncharacterized DUF497 family protein
VRFAWDERKRSANREKHRLDFADVPEPFAGPRLIARNDREDYGEERWVLLGYLHGDAAAVVYTEME